MQKLFVVCRFDGVRDLEVRAINIVICYTMSEIGSEAHLKNLSKDDGSGALLFASMLVWISTARELEASWMTATGEQAPFFKSGVHSISRPITRSCKMRGILSLLGSSYAGAV